MGKRGGGGAESGMNLFGEFKIISLNPGVTEVGVGVFLQKKPVRCVHREGQQSAAYKAQQLFLQALGRVLGFRGVTDKFWWLEISEL